MRISYIEKKFHDSSMRLIMIADQICREYQRKGFDLTLRQLYYQFVARAVIPNTMQSYKRLGSVLNDARLAGQLDWNYMVDRTRNLQGTTHWKNAEHIISNAAGNFTMDKWEKQPCRIEVWVEKEALAGVVGQVCSRLDLDFFCCRGYVSQSEMWSASNRLNRYIDEGQHVIVLHLGDHDPSGMDMTRDLEDRLMMFEVSPEDFEMKRIALNMDQIKKFNPPPKPAKTTDSRYKPYIRKYGTSSWELDALDPDSLQKIIEEHVRKYRDESSFEIEEKKEQKVKDLLSKVSNSWPDVVDYIEDL